MPKDTTKPTIVSADQVENLLISSNFFLLQPQETKQK